ncbi:MAG TPA: enoyl-CoA hydratase [Gammaproteobacteria bacterium]|nr:enoyl-CoA hydratase [Gammaproteobacteria bacterium]
MTDLVLREDRDGVAWLTLNRPDKLNALNVPLFSELDAHVKDIAHQIDSIGCVVLKGSGRCFSAGHDLSDISTGEKLPRPNFQAKVIEGLAELPQPVISAVHSHCYTGALELALAGDLIVASENGRFADTHGKWALQPVWGISQRLPRKVGRARATEMMLTGRTYTASEALYMDLVCRVFPDDEFESAVADYCNEILANSWHSLRGYKMLLSKTDGMSLDEGLAFEVYNGVGVGPDMRDRIAGFGSKK